MEFFSSSIRLGNNNKMLAVIKKFIDFKELVHIFYKKNVNIIVFSEKRLCV